MQFLNFTGDGSAPYQKAGVPPQIIKEEIAIGNNVCLIKWMLYGLQASSGD